MTGEKMFGDFAFSVKKNQFKNLKNSKSSNNFTFQLKKRNSELGRSLNFLILPPLDTMSGEVKWQRSIGPYFGYRCSTSVVIVVVARKMKAGQKYHWSSANPSE